MPKHKTPRPHKQSKSGKEGKDWLKELDAEASKRSRYSDWTEVDSLFKVMRHRSLRPKRPPKLPEAEFEADSKEVFDLIAAYEGEVAEKVPEVLRGLNARQRRQLSALLLDADAALDLRDQDREGTRHASKLARYKDGHLRMLKGKAQQAHLTLMELKEYAAGLDPVLGRKYEEVATECLARLAPYLEPDEAPTKARIEEERFGLPDEIKDPTGFNMVRVYWFFRSECLLDRSVAEIRVGQIRNALWRDQSGYVDVITEYNRSESPGCPAVRKAVSRYV